ncbi:glycosyltransferase family 2 protein [Arhodomonas sp. SL1]|uniref:glycosyltransferase family 2 protein n=1 Tax=Arhodomonas sp. SL1 TaxID=3425691 RepID=UPI003F8814BE
MPHDPSNEAPAPLFSVLIPSYNRARLLERALESLAVQTERDFEVIIIDDGSRDDTQSVIRRWRERGEFPISDHCQENGGKHAAHNAGLDLLRGELTIILNSDDCMTRDGLAILRRHWESIPLPQRADYAGVEGLCAFLADGRIAGDRYPADILDSDYITLRLRYGLRGDKACAARTTILKRYPYPVFSGERHMRPSLLWKRVAHEYRTRYVNEVVQLKEYLPDGLSANPFRRRMANPRGYRFYYREDTDHHQPRWRGRLESCVKYSRYSFHAGIGVGEQWRDIHRRGLWVMACPAGYVKYRIDRHRLARQTA